MRIAYAVHPDARLSWGGLPAPPAAAWSSVRPDACHLIGSGLVLTVMLAVVAVASGRLTGAGAASVTWLGSGPAGRLLTGLVQVAFVAATAGAVAVALWHRRFRLLAGLAAGAVAAGAVLAGIWYLAADSHPDAVTAAGEQHSWLASAAFP